MLFEFGLFNVFSRSQNYSQLLIGNFDDIIWITRMKFTVQMISNDFVIYFTKKNLHYIIFLQGDVL
jgi:hypothetical protein